MLPKWHILLGAVFSLLLWPVFGLGSLIIFASSFLVDFDHFLFYIKRTKNYNLLKAYSFLKKFAEKRKKEPPLFIFHVIEFWILLFVASLFSKFVSLAFIGIALHMFLDFLDDAFKKRRRQFSLVTWLWRSKDNFIRRKT